jgi:hypothetical protein
MLFFMHLTSIDRVESISAEVFRKQYYEPRKPLVITDLSKSWPAQDKWTWDYFKSIVGRQTVGLYNNERAGAKTLVNGADAYISFGGIEGNEQSAHQAGAGMVVPL